MQPRSVDEFIAEVGACTSSDQLFSVYRAEIEREGFQNVIFGRQVNNELVELPYVAAPAGAIEAYVELNLAEHDPMIRLVGNRTPTFTWSEMELCCESKVERDTLGICREHQFINGLVIPFYGPHGYSDVFDLTFREARPFNPARKSILSVKTYAVWLRFLELDSVVMSQRIFPSATNPDEAVRTGTTPTLHFDGHENISADECRALTICDIAARRYKAALPQLNDGLADMLGPEMFQRLRKRGLLADVPDDDNMCYYYKPSPLAVAHLRRCPHVAEARKHVWQLHVRRDERPIER